MNINIFKYRIFPPSWRRIVRWIEPEALIWFAVLCAFALMTPSHEPQFSFCLFHALGIDWCPGCGLGRSIVFFLHGDIQHSLNAHPLGIAAFIMLLSRIVALQLRRKAMILAISPLSSPHSSSTVTERTFHG